MGRDAMHSQEQVFQVADKMAAAGEEVTATALRKALGGGSMTTMYKHLEKWQEGRKSAVPVVVIEMPDSVKLAFTQCWQAAAVEAGKEIAAIREKADAEIKAIRRRLDEAVAEIAQLEGDADTVAAKTEQLEASLGAERAAAQQAATDFAAREASLSATAEQMRSQIGAQQQELSRFHADAEAANKRHAEEVAALRADYENRLQEQGRTLQAAQERVARQQDQLAEAAEIQASALVRERSTAEDAAKAKAEVVHLGSQLRDQVARHAEVLARAEKNESTAAADLALLRSEVKSLVATLGSANGERDALRLQVASQEALIKGFVVPHGGNDQVVGGTPANVKTEAKKPGGNKK